MRRPVGASDRSALDETIGVRSGWVGGNAWRSKAAAPNSEGFREQELSGHALPPSPSYGGTGHTLREVRPRRRGRLWVGVCTVR
ncbi:hypothetical protein SBV1_1860030 [Verrucomicrobia bacterium]|nr:hypothetical protein SBV1_1860030 [Verrucomicrobiota bacterium]